MQTDRPRWQKPAVMVLVRNRPEEAVMSVCKELAAPGGSYNDTAGGCQYTAPTCMECSFQLSS
jgi:hypothetical protein